MNCKLTEFSSPVENEVHVDSCKNSARPWLHKSDTISDSPRQNLQTADRYLILESW
jgi:hypothetical protein